MPRNSQTDKEDIAAHFKKLNISTLKEYQEFCRANGLSRNTNKTYAQRREEVLIVTRQKAIKTLSEQKKFKRPEIAVLKFLDQFENYFGDDKEIFHAPILPINLNLPAIASVVHNALFKADKAGKLESAKKIIRHLLSMDGCCAFEHLNAQKSNMLNAIGNIVLYDDQFINPIETWKPKSHNAYRQYSSLLRHLFCKYTIPNFMDQVWLNDRALSEQDWFVHLGTGQNIRTAKNLPVPLTKKQAHYFCQAPENYTPLAAIRYGQICSFGGNQRLANVLLPTKMCELESFHHIAPAAGGDEFWQSVIRWFIENPMLDVVHVGPIIDWLINQKFTSQVVFVAPGQNERRPPPQPNLSMKKRDVESTLKAIELWHKQLGHEKKAVNLQWVSCGIKPFRFEEGSENNHKIWMIDELLSGKELADDGKRMHHCVSSYASSCHQGRTSIWSLSCQDKTGINKKTTIEVNLSSKQIVQARGAYNAKPNQQEINIIHRWAGSRGLSIGRYVF